MKKLFVHLEGPAETLTVRLPLAPAIRTLDDVLKAFCAAHTRKSQSQRRGTKGTLSPPLLAPDDLDVFIEREHESERRVPFAADKRAQRWFAQQQRTLDDAGDGCDFELVVLRKQQSTASRTRTGSGLAALVTLGLQHLEQRKLRAAKTLFETLVLPIDPENPPALLALGDIHAANHRYDVAVTHWYRKCWDALVPVPCDGDRRQRPFRDSAHAQLAVDCGLKIAHCEIQCGSYREALRTIDRLQWLLETDSPLASAEKSAAIARTNVLKAQAWYALRTVSPELQDAAVALLAQLLPDLQSPHLDLDALLLYATIAFDCGKKSEALNMVLRVLVGRSTDKVVRQRLATFVGDKRGMELLILSVPPEGGLSSAAAHAFIGTILKDCGALEASVACFEYAQLGHPTSPTYALNHAHVLEVCNENERALDVLASFFRQNPTLATGDGQLTSQDVLAVLDTHGWGLVSAAVHPTAEDWRVEWCAGDSGRANVFLNGEVVGRSGATSDEATPQPLDPDELDLLACFFTVVKVRLLAWLVAAARSLDQYSASSPDSSCF